MLTVTFTGKNDQRIERDTTVSQEPLKDHTTFASKMSDLLDFVKLITNSKSNKLLWGSCTKCIYSYPQSISFHQYPQLSYQSVLDQHPFRYLANTQTTLDWQWVSWPSVNQIIHTNQKLSNQDIDGVSIKSQSSVNQGVDKVLIKYRVRCQSRISIEGINRHSDYNKGIMKTKA